MLQLYDDVIINVYQPRLPDRTPLASRRDLLEALKAPKSARAIVKWVLRSNRLPEYRLTVELESEGEGEEPSTRLGN